MNRRDTWNPRTRDQSDPVFPQSLPALNEEAHRTELFAQLVEFTEELAAWQDMNTRWGHINNLIRATNYTYERLGIDEKIPEGLY